MTITPEKNKLGPDYPSRVNKWNPRGSTVYLSSRAESAREP